MEWAMANDIQLSRRFTVERYSRAIDACEDTMQLRSLAKLLLGVWQKQTEATERYGAELLGIKQASGGQDGLD